MNTTLKLHGLVAAVHTPFKADGSLNPSIVDAQAKLLAAQGIKLAFITGSTGESSSMQLAERKEIYSAWKEASARHGVDVIAHTGSNSVWDARELAAFAQECGFVATSSLSPSYYKPGTVQRLVECCAFAASAISLEDTEPKVLPPSPALILTTTCLVSSSAASAFAASRFSCATFSSFALWSFRSFMFLEVASTPIFFGKI